MTGVETWGLSISPPPLVSVVRARLFDPPVKRAVGLFRCGRGSPGKGEGAREGLGLGRPTREAETEPPPARDTNSFLNHGRCSFFPGNEHCPMKGVGVLLGRERVFIMGAGI